MVEGREKGEVAEWLRLKECPGCGYSLVGLMEEGVCPECGRGYMQGFVVLSGRGRGKLDGAAGGTWRGLIGQGVVAVGLLSMFLLTKRLWENVQMMSWGLAAMVFMGMGFYARLLSWGELRMQLWMSRKGVAQVLSTPEGRVAGWMSGMVWKMMMPIMCFGPMLQLLRRPGLVIGVAAGVYVMGGLVIWWRVGEKRREFGSVEYVPTLLDWRKVEKVSVEELSNGRARIRCYVPRYWGMILVHKDWGIDIEVECPAELLEVMRREMDKWWRDGRGLEV